MNHIVDHLARLTEHRERGLLDLTLARALMDLATPISVALLAPLGEGDDARWLQRVSVGPGEALALSDPMTADLQALPRLDRHPLHRQCLETRQLICQQPLRPGEACVTLFPLFNDSRAEGVVEIRSLAPLDEPMQRMIAGMQRVYCNMYRLLDYSELDTLTGLLNRKSFDEVFYRTIPARLPGSVEQQTPHTPERRTAEPAQSWWLGMIDIDHFKQVNDRFGHLIGDEVLLLAAGIMRKTFRQEDRLYRFGGEEFLVLVRCFDETEALRAFGRLRRNIETYEFPQVGHITISIGVSRVLPSDSPSSAIDRADQSVYFAKNHGRNQVCNYTDLVRTGAMDEELKEGAIELF